MRRRDLILSAPALVAATSLGGPVRADGAMRREFRILRGGDDIGSHTLEALRVDDRFEIDIDIDIRVTVLGFTAYRYLLRNREVWQGKTLAALDATTDDDGEANRVQIRREGEVLRIDGTGYQGTAPLETATTSYYATPFLERRPWVSTQSGKPLEIDVAETGARRFQVSGEIGTLLIYDEAGEWVGCEFDAGGEPARYEMTAYGGEIGALWAAA